MRLTVSQPAQRLYLSDDTTLFMTGDALEAELDQMVPANARLTTTLSVVIPRRVFEFYSKLKRVAELRLGFQTTFVVADKVKDFSKGADQHCANIGLKINLRETKASNHKIDRANLKDLNRPYDKKDIQEAECDTIVLGADVTHPMGHCAPGCPSIAAVVGSIDDDFTKFPGSMRLQRGRQEMIRSLDDMVMERLVDWADEHEGRLPGSVLFYRDGVSESQFDDLRNDELVRVQQGYDKAENVLRTRQGMPASNNQ